MFRFPTSIRRAWPGLLALLLALPAYAQVAQDDAVVARLHAAGQRHETPHVVLWSAPEALGETEAEALANALEQGVVAIGALLGTQLDTAHYAEDKVHVFVARGIDVSHVYGGYRHPQYDKPYLFLDVRRVRGGRAPYLHELTHLLAWRFGSHSLREGLASYVELELAAAGHGRSSGLFGMTDRDAAHGRALALLATEPAAGIVPQLGGRGGPEGGVTGTDDAASRETYYVLAQSFVRFLVERIGLPEFLQVYGDDDPDAAVARLTGAPMDVWRARWLQSLRGAPAGG
ncbi:MAG TPA: hypothetical protein VEY50_11620 [Lysobacter sp.]|nr:hypothetical protein [Lysobacter sp.]